MQKFEAKQPKPDDELLNTDNQENYSDADIATSFSMTPQQNLTYETPYFRKEKETEVIDHTEEIKEPQNQEETDSQLMFGVAEDWVKLREAKMQKRLLKC